VAVLQAGQHADVVVVTNGALTELENKGLVRRGRVSLATTGFGLATRSGDLAPDISTPEALRAAVLGASKVIYNDPKVTPSGQLLLHIAERLGVAEQVKAKSTVVALSVMVEITGHPGGEVSRAAAEGAASPAALFRRAGRASWMRWQPKRSLRSRSRVQPSLSASFRFWPRPSDPARTSSRKLSDKHRTSYPRLEHFSR
jgi:hypothetical protein